MDRDLRIQELEKELAESNTRNNSLEEKIHELHQENVDLKSKVHAYKELILSSPSMITLLCDKDLKIKIANDPILKFWKKDKSIIGQPLIDAHPDIREQGLEKLLHNVMESGKPEYGYETPVYITREDRAELCYFNFIYQPQRDIDGKINGVAVIAQEVTSEAKMHKKIEESEIKYRTIADFMPHKISIADASGNTLFYNKSWRDYTGLSMDELIDKHWSAIIHPEHRELVETELEECLVTGKSLDIELKILNKEQEYKWHLCRAIAIKDEENNITSWISSSTEIQKLKEEEQRKEDFLKLVSHELKTPVTSIKGYVQLLLSLLKDRNEEGVPVEQSKPYLHRIENQVEKLIILISEMLDLSRIEQNELELHKEEFSLNEHIENIIEDISYTHKDVQIEMEHLYDCRIVADKDRIGQVIINFITNALKYSPDSKKVNVRIFQHEVDNVAVSVRDYGIGIDRKDFKKIFNRFYRVSSKNEKTYAGFGIGLYLSNEIIERHKGEIFVQSKIGEGSEFTFTLPINQD